ncbi:MAG TPA: PKD domain-containing protein, partial [Anaerolineae bacterium]|nr:PKD domain-containing protein [Anaerolineae bacterium]
TPIPPTPTPTPTAVPLPPELSALTIQPSVVEIEVDILAGAVFTDPDPRPGTHIAEWDWGDGSPLTVKEVEPGLALANHAYLDAGIYTVAFKVTNPIGLSTAAHPESVVVFDPSGGFVTGAGWINSTAGAYCPDPSLVGKANFGFVSKYVKGKQAPTGNTQFQFKTAGLTFSSEDYDWLVVTGGDSANFKGTGTINGQLSPAGDPYKFKVWAGDGEPDTLRIRIWYEYEALEDMEFVIYDNVDLLCDEVDDGGPKQPIGGGQIIVHAGKGK